MQDIQKLGLAALAGGATVYAFFALKRCRSAPQFAVSADNPKLVAANPLPALLHHSIITTVGKTPIIKLKRLSPKGVNIYVKLEAQNPAGSVKDRLAVGMIEWAETHGMLKPGQTVVEVTSGNTGIGMAMVCAAKGYPFVAIMPENASVERRKILRFYGAKVLMPSLASGSGGMWHVILKLVEKKGYYWPNQFKNEANAWIHRRTTGPEILEAMAGVPVDYFVSAFGTGGTLKGTSQYLRAHSPGTKIVVLEPEVSPVLSSGIKTRWNADGTMPAESHPRASAHLFQGWAPDFISHLTESARELKLYDKIENRITGPGGMAMAKRLALEEGIFTGLSGGGAMLGAMLTAKECPVGSNIVVILADTGERYLSTPLFDGISADMDAEEKALVAECGPMGTEQRLPQQLLDANGAARRLVADAISGNKVVTFAFDSCEFCWTLKKLLAAIGVDCTQVDIDQPKYECYEGRIRAAIQEMSGAKTFPQLFIGGEFYGGAVDVVLAWKKGELQSKLEKAGAKPPKRTAGDTSLEWNGYEGDPFEFVPKWLSINPLRHK